MTSDNSHKTNIFEKLKSSWRSSHSQKDSSPPSSEIVIYTGPDATPTDSSLCVDYYRVLGVDRHASQDSIRAAYHARARIWHPDKNDGSDQSKQKFIQLQRAYAVLSDPNKRAIYDRFGMMGLDVAERCDEDQQQYMAEFASSKWALLLMCMGLLTCCFCCCCCFGCCSMCRRHPENEERLRKQESKRREKRKAAEFGSDSSICFQPTRILQQSLSDDDIKIRGLG